jgi:hypothetical protein
VAGRKIIAVSISQHGEKPVVPAPFSKKDKLRIQERRVPVQWRVEIQEREEILTNKIA